MISLTVIDARVKRKKFPEHAGDQFVPREDVQTRIAALRQKEGNQFLFGIYESDDKWTALSVDTLFGCYDGAMSELDLCSEAELIHGYFGEEGGKHKSNVFLKDGRKFWMKTAEISSGFQNIILMVQKLPTGITLEE